MKSHCFLIILIFAISAFSCERSENGEIINLDVDLYIELLRSNQYDSLNLPSFNPNDIPALLKYRNEDQIITNFPHNPISSLWGPECKLGMYVLWTIESVRAVSINSKYLIIRFPSQNPILAKRNVYGLKLVDDTKSHEIAAQVYYDWWYSNDDYNKIKYIDPLGNTDYKWH